LGVIARVVRGRRVPAPTDGPRPPWRRQRV